MYPNRSPARPNSLDDSVHDFEGEPDAVVNTSAILVRAIIARGLEELVNKVPIGSVHFDYISNEYPPFLTTSEDRSPPSKPADTAFLAAAANS